MAKAFDPTKEPEFQKVVQAFLQTPPKPHKAPPKRKVKSTRKDAKSNAKPR
jgi:hypothetical protein